MTDEDRCVLVTGGAGYVGSHVIVELVNTGFSVAMFDINRTLVEECMKKVKEITGKSIHGYTVNLLDEENLASIFKKHQIYCVLHLAGLKAARESHGIPLQYYKVNVSGTLTLIQVMEAHGVFNLIFSSSSKVYGTPKYLPLDESHPIGHCTNPYGKTKLIVEEFIKDLSQADKRWNVTVLRYFNPCGAHPSGVLGESQNSGAPKNIMPAVCQAALGKLQALTVFGDDYDTPDGTAVKDYTHVVDLAKGHIAAVRQFARYLGHRVYNLGAGNQYSILDMVKAFEKISGKQISVEMCGRKTGEIAVCYSDNSRALKDLNWKAERTLDCMCEDLWNFEMKHQAEVNHS